MTYKLGGTKIKFEYFLTRLVIESKILLFLLIEHTNLTEWAVSSDFHWALPFDQLIILIDKPTSWELQGLF